jgi:ribosomal protein S18 acetylase RimI-like enzyme
MEIVIRPMAMEDIARVVELQKLAFPPPFSEDLHWDPEHLVRHIELFPTGQFVAEDMGKIVGSCSNSIVSELQWQKHGGWGETVGGPNLRTFDRNGTTLYGLDITVHPDYRRQGIGRSFYRSRYSLVKSLGLARFGTGCRLPDFRNYATTRPGIRVEDYVERVVRGEATDRTLTPLLRMDLECIGVVRDYMPDEESANAAALLEWKP